MLRCGVFLRVLVVFWCLSLFPCVGQEERASVPPEDALDVQRNLDALKGVAGPFADAIAETDRLMAEIDATTSESQKADLANRLRAEQERIAQLRGNFREIVGGSESAGYDEVKETERTLQDQFSDLLDPLVGALREPTEDLRHMEQVRKDLSKWLERFAKAERVIARIDGLLSLAQSDLVKAELESARRLWEGRRSDATGQIEVLRLQLEERERTTPSFWEAVSRMFRNFWSTRGLNLILALLAAFSGYYLVRKGFELLRKAVPPLRKEGGMWGRAAGILGAAAAVLVALMAVLAVFFLRGDWLLLTLVIILLVSAAWAGKTALPPYVEQIKMLLNLGAVREGERLIYGGLPWSVTKLGFYTTFENPALEGGTLRIPLKKVMEMISRNPDLHEPWFPTEKDDWVILHDGTYGKVVRQTPEQVVVLKLGGSRKTYPTEEFLEQLPENLSRGFRVSGSFGIDYAYQEIATGPVIAILGDALNKALFSEFGREVLCSVKVEFSAAAASSLDYAILADFTGEAAHRLRYIERMIQKICVDVCNDQKWTIPFTQITVHQAAG